MDSAPQARVLVIGLGPMGRTVIERISSDAWFTLAGAVDPAYAGENVGGAEVAPSLDALAGHGADVAVVATGSEFPLVHPDLARLVEHGLDVVSTCEELAFPAWRNPELGSSLDYAARTSGVTVVGTGVNPGFMMDPLPAALTSASADVRRVLVQRAVNLSARRPQLREKMGAGLSMEHWEEAGGATHFGHRGLEESACLCGAAIGWQVDRDTLSFERRPEVVGGTVHGLSERATWSSEGRELMLAVEYRLDFVSRDVIEIEDGDGRTASAQVEGLNGDAATVARTLSAVHVVQELPAGLLLPIDLPTRSRRRVAGGINQSARAEP